MGRRRVGYSVLALVVVLLGAGYVVYGGGETEHAGTVHGTPLPSDTVRARGARQRGQAPEGTGGATQILFGDLHVHTTFSADAFMRSLPLMGGEGAHPPADACDFARFCSSLDFFALTDHAESLTPRRWAESKESIRQCNAVAGDRADPDLVAFTGFEWTQVGATPETHYGHKNVIFRHTGEDRVPVRPIAASGFAGALRELRAPPRLMMTLPLVPILDFDHRDRYLDLVAYQREIRATDTCPSGVDARELPADCFEVADTPRQLFEKLGQWGSDALVIPHGTTWGFYTPPGYVWDKQLDPAQDDPEQQRLLEVMSGHGNAEEHAAYRAFERGPDGERVCPEPTDAYEPCCWRAGEIIRGRCEEPGSADCDARVAKARHDYLIGGASGHLAVPGATVEDWKDCGQCRDCYTPAFMHRPGGSAQYILAKGWFGDDGEPRHANYGFLASSDNHAARPGTGYKEVERRRMTEATGPISPEWRERIFGERPPAEAESVALPREEALQTRMPFELVDLERQASFFMTGGLVAVHSAGRDRDAIWEALRRREVYGTSGPRILLWFDLLGEDGERVAMGGDVPSGVAPRFEVRAVGAFEQKPGCPAWTSDELGPERLQHLCAGECYNPTDRRHRIDRIEVVRIRRQRDPEEDVGPLIEDVWRTLECPKDGSACTVQFDDPEFTDEARDMVYYVRAIQEPTPAINADGVRCRYDAEGNCVETDPCYGDYRTASDDDCTAPSEERAWSSPIFVRYDAAAASADAGKDGAAP
ncbi:MAG: DUF3604 domain-containing protein [Myxococcota bacterium]